MNNQQKSKLIQHMADLLELPQTAYDKARTRYEDIGEWFNREESALKSFDPHIFPQGSFRLLTAIRPLDEREEYDLDLACKLQEGITQANCTQKNLKELVGHEIETYRTARGIKAPKEEKHRCWRLDYADTMSFHMDIVPCIPGEENKRQLILNSMKQFGESESISQIVSQLTVSITDDRHNSYSSICNDWGISNPEGYAKWFETRTMHTPQLFEARAQVDDIPTNGRKTPLQRAIQILKRHRDQMFINDQEAKPISIIITTLAARSYQGESDLETALTSILSNMDKFINSNTPRVPNPVDPNEDFADRWAMPQYKHLKLEQNFKDWLTQARTDFQLLSSSDDVDFIIDQAKRKFSVQMNVDDLRSRLGLGATSSVIYKPKVHTIVKPAKPWKSEK